MVWIENNNYDIYQNISDTFLNLLILKFATKYNYLSSMADGIGRAHKFGKNRQKPGVTNDPSNAKEYNSHG